MANYFQISLSYLIIWTLESEKKLESTIYLMLFFIKIWLNYRTLSLVRIAAVTCFIFKKLKKDYIKIFNKACHCFFLFCLLKINSKTYLLKNFLFLFPAGIFIFIHSNVPSIVFLLYPS
ncbi:hypothetical protein H312_00803 [Anncaliia algerae PRA339]|uniref:Uncharacterized protein n=1 Tax=Anncaliia algerae PRA339 TaxID=1288291 RepID=A0A059F3A0_9MICR|nr:hypothetical protein H312_00803 [Anncaliia algerae PRA339]